MANRRHGGPNRFPGNSMPNPWQGGAPPVGVGGISQLSDRQAQFALALTNLFNIPPMGGGPVPPPYHQFDRRRLPPGRMNRFDKMNANNRPRQRNDQNKSDGPKKSNEKNDNQSGEEKKREWKDDKNEDGSTAADDENGDAKEGEKEEGAGGDGDQRKKDGRYVGIPQQYLKCAICEKSMWDGESFEKHLRGRAHQQMCDSIDESFRIQADMMRQCIRLAEERKAIELNRMKRHGKRVDLRKVSHCNMCNFDFYGREAEHRRSEGHQKLKRFLHPRCKRCRVEFSTKIEWEEHRLAPDHIRKIIEMKDSSDSASVDGDLHDGVMDLNIDVDDYEADDINPDNVLTDFNDETDIMSDFENRVPCYKKSRLLGESLMQPITGYLCKICNRFFDNEQKMQVHGKTRQHYDQFIKYLRTKHSDKVKQLNEDKSTAKHSIEEEEEMNTEDDEGNWKRRKLSGEDDVENGTTAKNDLYDPMEAEEDDGDDEKIKNLDDDGIKAEPPTLEDIAAEEALLNENIDEAADTTPAIKEEKPPTPVPATRATRRTSRVTAAATPQKPGPASKTRGRN